MNQMAVTSCVAQGDPAQEKDFVKKVGPPSEGHEFQVVRASEADFVLRISQCTGLDETVEQSIRVTMLQVEEFQKGLNQATHELRRRHPAGDIASQKPPKARQRWTDEDRRLLNAYVQSRVPFDEIAEAMGRSRTAIISQVIRLESITDKVLYQLLSQQEAIPVPDRFTQASGPPMRTHEGHDRWPYPL
jgi:hypothetical protein